MENFTPYSALAGGAMIGVAAVFFMVFNGRIAGISGIVGSLTVPKPGDIAWRLAFTLGLVAAPACYLVLGGAIPDIDFQATTIQLVVAGLLVGFGSQVGNGCTSGHGVCGMARLSKRSIVATMTFMATAGVTVFVVRHVLGG